MRKIITLCQSLLLAIGLIGVPAQKAAAAEATTVFIELSGNTSEIFSTNYLRGRVLFLDANGELATTFNGASINDAYMELQALSSTSAAQWSLDSVNNLNPSFVYTSSEKATINLDVAYQEFAVRFYNPVTGAVPDVIGAETIRATLKKGSTSISGESNITIKAPEANCFVVRTGQIVEMPDVLDELPVRQNNSGATNSAGQSVTMNVFAAKYYNSKYYFTDNVPEAANTITVLGAYVKSILTGAIVSGSTAQTYTSNLTLVGALTDPSRSLSVQLATATVTLADGYAATSIPIQNLQIPNILSIEGLILTANASAMSGILDGYTIYWYPMPSTTRMIGNKSNDVTSGDMLNVSASSIIGLMDISGYNDFDTSAIKPSTTTKISIIGLPVNEVNGSGSYLEAGIGGAEMAAGALKINPLDAYYLLEDWKIKPSSFRVAAKQNSNFIYGAIVARDTYGNPAPFYAGDTVRFELKKTSSATAINSSTAELRPANGTSWATSGAATAGAITATSYYQAFLPFQITVTAASGSATIEDLYISAAKRGSTYALLSSSLIADIDTYSEGVKFIGQQYVGAITPTTNFDTTFAGKVAATVGTLQVMGSSSEKSFDMRGVTVKGRAVSFGEKNITSPGAAVTSITLPTDIGNLAKKDVAVCTALAKNQKTFLIFKGTSNNTLAVIPVTLTTASMTAADSGDFGISLILAQPLATGKVYLDEEGDHQTAVIGSGNYLVYDGFGNKYGCLSYWGYFCADTTPLTLTDADLSAKVYTIDDNGIPTSTLFPGASADFNGNTVEVGFDPANITADQSKAAVTIAPEGGSPSSTINLYTTAMKALVLDDIFLPVAGITNTPIKAYFADQAGVKTLPVTTTASIYGAKGNRLNIGLRVNPEDNGTISAPATEYIYTANPSVTNYDNTVRFTARISSAFDSMGIDGSSYYGDHTLVLRYDFETVKPVIGDLTPIDCGFTFPVTDNKAVDAPATVVTVKNELGEDITGTVTVSTLSDNGTKAVIKVLGTGTGNFSVEIVAKDKAGNINSTTRIVTVPICSTGPACSSVDPSFAVSGSDHVLLVIKARNTHFVQGITSAAFSCPGITVNSLTVYSNTEITADISIAENMPDSSCSITISTGDEHIICNNAFEVIQRIPCSEYDDGNLDIMGRKGFTGDSVAHTVRINNAPNDVSAFGFDIAYDSSFLQFADSTKSTRMNNFNFTCTNVYPGLVRCGGYEKDSSATIHQGESCDVTDIVFTVLQSPCTTGLDASITPDNLVDDVKGWTTTQGCFKCQCPCDLDENGSCTPWDAMWRFIKYLNGYGDDSLCYDVTGDGKITPADALCTMRQYLDIHPNCFD